VLTRVPGVLTRTHMTLAEFVQAPFLGTCYDL
jgi:hypothetical protein